MNRWQIAVLIAPCVVFIAYAVLVLLIEPWRNAWTVRKRLRDLSARDAAAIEEVFPKVEDRTPNR